MSLLRNINKNAIKIHVHIFTNLKKKLIKKFDICSAE